MTLDPEKICERCGENLATVGHRPTCPEVTQESEPFLDYLDKGQHSAAWYQRYADGDSWLTT